MTSLEKLFPVECVLEGVTSQAIHEEEVEISSSSKKRRQIEYEQYSYFSPPVYCHPGCSCEYGMESVIVFDWDDTLLASSLLAKFESTFDCITSAPPKIPAFQLEELKRLSNAVNWLLRSAMTFGRVFIITNSETGWVEASAKRYVPELLPVLSEIQIISARSLYQSEKPDDPLYWKTRAFSKMLEQNFSMAKRKNLISIGDSNVEREALVAVSSCKSHNVCIAKSVKLKNQPTVLELRTQVESLYHNLPSIYTYLGNLDLALEDSRRY